VKFLLDAQLPARLCGVLAGAGHEAIHTSALPEGNRTSDREIARVADADDRVVISKDRDFRDSHLLDGSPRRLLVVATGNIRNDQLIALVERNIGVVVAAFDRGALVELRTDRLIVHGS